MSLGADLTAAAAHLDLVGVPFTQPGSRLMVHRDTTDGLIVSRAEYEVSPINAIVLSALRCTDHRGQSCPVSEVTIDRIVLGPFTLTVVEDRVSICSPTGGHVRALLPNGDVVDEQVADGEALVFAWSGRELRLTRDQAHPERLFETLEWWRAWFGGRPAVEPALARFAAHLWWVLGVNQVTLSGHEGIAVVPSKLGYVGLWQWDAYFIAIGLRHTRIDLAARQLDLALRYACPTGQLPDVVHDGGVLASSADLPPADLARLRELGSPAADPELDVPLTKPPLAALAVQKLVEAGLDEGRWVGLLPAVIASQEWWLRDCLAADGLPEYGHPYSSGLDDSPVFDADLPVATPDLAAYLELQDLVLADLHDALDEPSAAQHHRIRSRDSHGRLMRLWQEEGRRFAARGLNGPVAAHTVVDLLPLLTGTLPPEVVDALVADLADPATFGGDAVVPTVSRSDPTFDARAMWRGPVWVSTNWLLIEGLERSGRQAQATALARRTLDQAAASGGAFEYLDADQGVRAPRAVAAFSWTAALVLDLAVRFPQES